MGQRVCEAGRPVRCCWQWPLLPPCRCALQSGYVLSSYTKGPLVCSVQDALHYLQEVQHMYNTGVAWQASAAAQAYSNQLRSCGKSGPGKNGAGSRATHWSSQKAASCASWGSSPWASGWPSPIWWAYLPLPVRHIDPSDAARARCCAQQAAGRQAGTVCSGCSTCRPAMLSMKARCRLCLVCRQATHILHSTTA